MEFKLSKRVAVRPGDVVRLSRGPVIKPTNCRMGPKGKFVVSELFKRRGTTYAVLSSAIDSKGDGGSYTCRLTGGKRRHKLCPDTVIDMPFKLRKVK